MTDSTRRRFVPAPDEAFAWLALGLIGLLFIGASSGPGWRDTFTTYVIAILLQALPYLVLGSLIGAAIEAVVPGRVLPLVAARLGPLGIPAVVALSPLIPVCECAVIAVGRALLRRGLPMPHVIAYLLAAPILNPTVIASTLVAFPGSEHALARCAGGLAIPILIGWGAYLWHRRQPAVAPMLRGFQAVTAPTSPLTAPPAPLARPGLRGLAADALQHFTDMAGWFVFGTVIAAALKTWVGDATLATVGAGPIAGPATMMAAAVAMSLCAEADAFIAASFTGFGFAAVTGFLVLGPMLDLKLLLMYRTLLGVRAIAALALAILLATSAYVALLQSVAG